MYTNSKATNWDIFAPSVVYAYRTDTIDKLKVVHEHINGNLAEAQASIKTQHDKKTAFPKFVEGDKVLLYKPGLFIRRLVAQHCSCQPGKNVCGPPGCGNAPTSSSSSAV
jgi:hypothetical protein